MVPGMEHCTNGVGLNKFDTITALENWVEHSVAPDGIIATKYDGDIIGSTVLRAMPLCKYPEQAHYTAPAIRPRRQTGAVRHLGGMCCGSVSPAWR
jgi:hypothetical protein